MKEYSWIYEPHANTQKKSQSMWKPIHRVLPMVQFDTVWFLNENGIDFGMTQI